MSLKNIKFRNILLEKNSRDEWEDDWDWDAWDDNYSKRDYNRDNNYDDYDSPVDSDDEGTDDKEHLSYLIRTMFNNYELNANVEISGYDIAVYLHLERKEKMKTILRAFEVINKMKADILPEYEVQFELFETTKGLPIMCFEFFFNKEK